MNIKTPTRKELKKGMAVEVTPQSDRKKSQLIQGNISEILTKSEQHPYGILVSLETGETGRVKRILDGKESPTSEAPGKLHELMRAGETHTVEFKKDILWSSRYTSEDIKNHRPQTKELHQYGQATSRILIAKALAAFLNSSGGTLIVGVQENKNDEKDEIVGIECEFEKLKDPCIDGYRRMIVDLIEDYLPSRVFHRLNTYFDITFEEIDGHIVCGIEVSKADKAVFINLNKKNHFFIRTDASTRELTGEELLEYCQTRFQG